MGNVFSREAVTCPACRFDMLPRIVRTRNGTMNNNDKKRDVVPTTKIVAMKDHAPNQSLDPSSVGMLRMAWVELSENQGSTKIDGLLTSTQRILF